MNLEILTPKVSVLMTVFNGGVYLSQAVESVLKQTYKDFELLIVDDCSTDGATDLIRQLQDSRIKIHHNTQNLGQTKSLNVGLRMAKGKYVARMDADDMAYPHWLVELVNIIESQDECAVLSPQAVVMDVHNKIKKELRAPLNFQEIVFKSIFASPINHVGCLMRRDIILEAGGYDEQYKIIADYVLWSTLLRQGIKVLICPRVLVAVRSHEHSISVQEADKRVILEMVEVMGQNITFWSSLKVKDKEVMLLWRLVYAGHRLGEKELPDALQLFEQVYCHWHKEKMDKVDASIIFWQQQETVLLLKRIWFLMKEKNYVSIRQTAILHIQKRGKNCSFLLIWLLTYLPMGLTCATVFYEFLMTFKARRKIVWHENN